MRQKGFAPLIIVLVIAILGVIGYFGYKYFNSDSQALPTTTSTTTPIPPFLSPSTTNTTNWKSFINTAYFFEFMYPTDWHILTGSPAGNISESEWAKSDYVSIAANGSGSDDNISINVDPISRLNLPLSPKCETLNECVSKFIAHIDTSHKVVQKQLNIGKMEAVQIIFDTKTEPLTKDSYYTAYQSQIFLKSGNYLYYATMYDYSTKNIEIYNQIISTLKFTQ